MSTELIFFLDLAARSALILAAAWLVVRQLPNLSAATRYWIWLTALCLLPLLLLTANLPSKNFIEIETSKVTDVEPALAGLMAAPTLIENEITPPEPVTSPAAVVSSPLLPTAALEPVVETTAPARNLSVFLWIYLLGAIVTALPLAAGLLRLRRLRGGSGEFDCDAGGVETLVSSRVRVPMTWGTFRPTILLPESARAWSRQRLQLVIAHETAHIARRDFATGLLASVLRSAFWFQPLAWLALNRLRAERELACDDLVLRSQSAEAADYAEHLSAVARDATGAPPRVAIAMARPSEIVSRVRAILDSARNRTALSNRAKQRIALLSIVLFAPLAFVRCAAEKSSSGKVHTTGAGIELAAVDPSAVNITIDGEIIEIPSGEKFSMATREVTQAEFQEVLGHNPASTKAAHLPVDQVTRTEAATFCKVLTERDRASGALAKGKIYRLPTQREWLLAAFPGGLVPTGEALDAIAWHGKNSTGLLHPVGAKEANAYGLHDMIGNAAEWTDPDPEMIKAAIDRIPGKFAGKVTMQISRSAGDEVFDGGPTITHKVFVQTQIAIIESREVLMPLIEKHNLRERWGVADAYQELKKRLRTKEIRGTDLISLTVYSDTGEDAAELANEIAKGYVDRVERSVATRSERVVAELKEEGKAQEKLMNESRERMLELMEESRIVDIGPNTPKWVGGGLATGPGSLVMKSKHAGTKSDVESLRTTIDSLKNLEGEELIKAAIQLGINNPTLANRYPEYETAKLGLKSLQDSGIGAKHPKILAAENTVSALKKMLVDAVEQSKRNLGTSLSVAQKRAAAESDPLNEKRRSVEYLAAKDEYELHKTLLTEMKQRIAIRMVNEKMPRKNVAIHELAVPMQVSIDAGKNQHPRAIGGTAEQDPEELLTNSSASGDDQRQEQVGFRFVMADDK